jgi:AraC-like DNA-binding protein
VIFKPFRLSVYFIVALLLAQIITHNIFQWDMGDYIFINSIISFAAVMYFWHLSLLLKDLENSNSIFRLPIGIPIKNPNIPQKSMSILQYIYLERIYKDPNLSIEKVAEKMGNPDVNLGQIFGTTIPFSFSSYINHLRLLEYEKGFNTRFDKTSNALNAGFNSLSAFYYWESRKEVTSKQINPVLEWIDMNDTSKVLST